MRVPKSLLLQTRYFPYIAYLILSFTLPIRRVLYVWSDDSYDALQIAFGIHFWIPLFIIVFPALASIVYPKSAIFKAMDNLTSPVLVNLAAYALLIVCLSLTFLGIPGLWWTWLTIGVHVCYVGIVVNLLHKRIRNIHAFFVASGFVLLAAGVWELMYHFSYYWHYAPSLNYQGLMMKQSRILSTFIIFGAGTTSLFFLTYRSRLIANNLAWVFLGFFLAAFGGWWLAGFWCDIMYDWENDVWYYTDFNWGQMALYRFSKVAFGAYWAILVTRREFNETLVRILSYPFVAWRVLRNNCLSSVHMVQGKNSKT